MPACQSELRSSQKVCAISVGLGSRKSWTSKATTSACQSDDPEHEDRERRAPVEDAALHRGSGHAATSPPASRSRTSVTSSKKRGSSRVRAVRG